MLPILKVTRGSFQGSEATRGSFRGVKGRGVRHKITEASITGDILTIFPLGFPVWAVLGGFGCLWSRAGVLAT